MKRISQQVNCQPLKTTKNLGNQMEFLRRDNKRHQTTFQPAQKRKTQNSQNVSYILNKNLFYTSTMVVDKLITDMINNLSKDIEKIQLKKIISSTIKMTNSITTQLYHMQNPQKTFNQPCPQAEQQPQKNHTDPISGFNKQNFIKRQQKSHHKHNSSLSNYSMAILQKQTQKSIQHPTEMKKLPPLMKQLSQQKLQKFVPLDEILCMRNSNKKASHDMQEIVRERFLKQIDNRKFNEKIQKINRTPVENVESSKANQGLKKNIGNRSAYDLNNSVDRNIGVKEDCNFDYDGNKIQVAANSKPKANLKILKPLYKLNKQKPQDNKPSKLNKKYHEKMSFVPRGSRNSLEFNSKTISDFGETDYTLVLKEKLQAQLRKTDMKFIEKQFQPKLSQQEKQKLNNRRQSLLNLN